MACAGLPRSYWPTRAATTRRTWRRASAICSCSSASDWTTPSGRSPAQCSRSSPRASTPSTSGAWTALTASTRVRASEAARPTACGGTAARPVMWACSRWPAWPRRRTSSSTSWISALTGRLTSSSRPNPTRATGWRSMRRPRRWSSATSSTTGIRRWRHPSPLSGSGPRGRRRNARRRTPGPWWPGNSSPWETSSSPTLNSSCNSRDRRSPTHSMLPSTGRRWAPRRRTDLSSGPGRLPPTRRSSSRSRRRKVSTGATRSGIPGGKPSTTARTRAASMDTRRRWTTMASCVP